MLLAGFFKLLIPVFIMLPGVIAFHLYGDSLASMDHAYPRLVRDVLPGFLTGIFLAVLLGAVFSSFNSLLQSSATLITFDVYEPWLGRETSDAQKIRIARIACLAITLTGFVVAPTLQLAPEGLWQLIRKFTGFYNIPIIALVLGAMFLPRSSSRAAIAVILFHIPAYALVTFWWETDIHFVHWYGILFVLEMIILMVVRNRESRIVTVTGNVDLTPWRYRWPAVAFLSACMIGMYLFLSPLGVAA